MHLHARAQRHTRAPLLLATVLTHNLPFSSVHVDSHESMCANIHARYRSLARSLSLARTLPRALSGPLSLPLSGRSLLCCSHSHPEREYEQKVGTVGDQATKGACRWPTFPGLRTSLKQYR
jgi:hypothetical protein